MSRKARLANRLVENPRLLQAAWLLALLAVEAGPVLAGGGSGSGGP